ncbi:molybdenum cofactor cytidylyltransferase [Clostridium sp. DJ247]|uniref:molybdenum cofactor cytidylyltransferase n=1 Tax=Clostridium sp. DJ247 TaxID=2726188 RepID=UPI001625F756|nr:molybdenum cofactor cytidylyltransferase [Clostridium sp. DJ247]MBC2581808.1 molybdenum cofactor cytidylyltransferase [Clostridium sp. DJ247]
MISAVILASGYGNRMGQNKLLLPYKGKTIIEHILDTVLSYPFHEIILIGREEEILNLAEKRHIKTVVNNHAYKGQSESIKLAIQNIDYTDGYIFFTGDQPLINLETIEFLVNTFNKNSNHIIVPKYKENRGSPVIFPKKFKGELLELNGDMGGRIVINHHLNDVIFAELDKGHVLFDVDTPEDYQTLLNANLR